MRISVPAVVVAGAVAVLWAGILAGGSAVWWCAAVAAVAIGCAALWEFNVRAGHVALMLVGWGVTILSGLALLTGGSLPWLLVAFWGGVAIILAATLDLVAGTATDRSASVAVVPVITLLFLSALGLALYVHENWTPQERRVLESLPIVPRSLIGASQVRELPVQGGEWAYTWNVASRNQNATVDEMVATLRRAGWSVTEPAPLQLLAHKDGYYAQIYYPADQLEGVPPAASQAPVGGAGTLAITVHVGRLAGGGPER